MRIIQKIQISVTSKPTRRIDFARNCRARDCLPLNGVSSFGISPRSSERPSRGARSGLKTPRHSKGYQHRYASSRIPAFRRGSGAQHPLPNEGQCQALYGLSQMPFSSDGRPSAITGAAISSHSSQCRFEVAASKWALASTKIWLLTGIPAAAASAVARVHPVTPPIFIRSGIKRDEALSRIDRAKWLGPQSFSPR